MGRLESNSAPSHSSGQHQFQTQYQISEYASPQQHHLERVIIQGCPEIIDDVPPPAFESSNQVNEQQNAKNEPPQIFQNIQQNQQSSKSTGGLALAAFPTRQSSQTNTIDSQVSKFPPENPQMWSFSRGCPPPPSQPQAFSPQANPQVFPPQPQPLPPPPQAQKQAAFLPTHCPPQAFPSLQANVHAFPPPFSPAPSFPQPSKLDGSGKNNTPEAVPACPFIQPIGHFLSTLIMGFPGVTQNPQDGVPNEPWQTDLFACMDNPGNALVTAMLPCVTYGQISEIVDNGQTPCLTSAIVYWLILPSGVPWILSCTNRSKIRARYGLMEYPAPDWMVHFFCGICALCQEYRELQLRGLDPSIGWQGNMVLNKNNQKQQSMVTPPMHQTMMG